MPSLLNSYSFTFAIQAIRHLSRPARVSQTSSIYNLRTADALSDSSVPFQSKSPARFRVVNKYSRVLWMQSRAKGIFQRKDHTQKAAQAKSRYSSGPDIMQKIRVTVEQKMPGRPHHPRAAHNGITFTRDSTAPSHTQSLRETSSSKPAVSSVTFFPFFRLPRELRDEIYAYVSMTEDVWIGRPPRFAHDPDDVIIDQASIYKPTTLVRTKHSIISVCHKTRNEFRAAVWREYMTSARQVHLRVYNFAFGPLEEFFASCSESEVTKLQDEDKCHVHHHLTTMFQEYRRSHNAYWEIASLSDVWLKFFERASVDADQSIDKCDWHDIRLLRSALEHDWITHIPEWEDRWDSPIFLDFWDVVSEAYWECSSARNAGRNAFHQLAPLGR